MRGTRRAHPFIMTIQTYRDLETWQACMDAVEHTYLLARKSGQLLNGLFRSLDASERRR